MIGTFFLAHWFTFNYAPTSGPWWTGAIWPNVFVVLIVAPLGWLWSKTKFFPLRPLQHGIKRLEEHHKRAAEHNAWAAKQIARMHQQVVGEPADQHPHHPDIGGSAPAQSSESGAD